MSDDFLRDNTDLWDDKVNFEGRAPNNPTKQWSAADAALAKSALESVQTYLRAGTLNIPTTTTIPVASMTSATSWLFVEAGMVSRMLYSAPPWTSIRYSEQAIKDSIPEFLLRLWNCYSFFVIYANVDGFDPAATDPHFLVTVLHPASGAQTCPADSHPYTLTVETNP